MRCQACGFTNKKAEFRCKKCGVKLAKACPRCSSLNKAEANFCKDCGWPLVGKFSKADKPFLCPKCRSPIEWGAPRCKCGAVMRWDQIAVEEDKAVRGVKK